MINLFAKIAADNNLFILFSSHSAETVTTLQQNEILLISDAGAPEIRFSPEKHVAMRRLGLITRPNVLVLAEDVDAHELLLQTWTKWGGEMNSAIEIQIMLGGAVELARLQRLFPVDARICILQVVLDGDKRNAHPDSPKVLFLPGVEDPVASARSHVTTDPVFFAGQLGVSPEQVHSAIEAIAFADHHDFCSNLSDRLGTQGIDTKRVRSCLFRAWLEEPSIAVQAKKLSERILQLVKLP
jgi:hypothetical protein